MIKLLGYNVKGNKQTNWNTLGKAEGLKDPNFETIPIIYKTWIELTNEERRIAAALDYDEAVWNQYQLNFTYYRKQRESKYTCPYTSVCVHTFYSQITYINYCCYRKTNKEK